MATIIIHGLAEAIFAYTWLIFAYFTKFTK